MPDTNVFTSQRCGTCAEPLGPDKSWGCAEAVIPVEGMPATIYFHQHHHIGCARGWVKWMCLRSLGRERVDEN